MERLAVVSMNELMRARNRAAALMATAVTADPASRTAMLGALHGRPWRVPAPDTAAEIVDFANAAGLHATVQATTGSSMPVGLSDIGVPVRVCFGTRDLMIGALTAPRFAAAVPGADLVPLGGSRARADGRRPRARGPHDHRAHDRLTSNRRSGCRRGVPPVAPRHRAP